MAKAAKKELKDTIADELAAMLSNKEQEPSEGRMKLLKLGIGFLAVQAKLEENEYGDFFNDPDPGSVPQGEKPAARKRARGNGAGEPDLGLETS